MPKTITIEVPEWVKEKDVYIWIAEGLSKEKFKDIILKILKQGMDVNAEKAFEEFEKTRKEVWKKIKKEYKEKGLI